MGAASSGSARRILSTRQPMARSQSLMANQDDFRKPVLPGKGASDYERYLRTDELLALQKLPEDLLHKDETTFIVVHQASELLMKGAAFELERALACIEKGDF